MYVYKHLLLLVSYPGCFWGAASVEIYSPRTTYYKNKKILFTALPNSSTLPHRLTLIPKLRDVRVLYQILPLVRKNLIDLRPISED